MANFTEESFDEEQQVEDLFSEQQEEAQEVIQEEPQGAEEEQPAAEVQEENEEDVPSKYKGKSLKDIVKMHQEAEKLIGRQAQEVGEVRKLADELIKRQLHTATQVKEEATKEDETDFLEDPDRYVKKAVEKHPAVIQAQQAALEMKKMQTLNRLQSEFPNLQEVVTDPSFAEWIKASPVRTKLYVAAETQLDYDSAAELLNTWNTIHAKKEEVQQAKEQNKQARSKALKAATVDTGTVGMESKKTYRRADLIRLQIQDPDRYSAMQPEIMAAYAEGRVI